MPAPSQKTKRNWTGIAGLIAGVLSWVFLTWILALIALGLGIFSLYKTRKESGKIAISAIAGIIVALAAIAVALLIK
jgi:hypothetical protein